MNVALRWPSRPISTRRVAVSRLGLSPAGCEMSPSAQLDRNRTVEGGRRGGGPVEGDGERPRRKGIGEMGARHARIAPEIDPTERIVGISSSWRCLVDFCTDLIYFMLDLTARMDLANTWV